jgi:hypothetical protein
MTAQELLATTKTFKPGTVTLEQYFRFLNGDVYELRSLGLDSTDAKMKHVAAEWGITEEEALAAYTKAGWI